MDNINDKEKAKTFTLEINKGISKYNTTMALMLILYSKSNEIDQFSICK